MIRIVAVDDEYHILERFERMAAEFDEIELCGVFTSGDELLEYQELSILDAVFLDIEMPGIQGIALSNLILKKNPQISIVFMTAFAQYAVQAFDINAIDYLLKPVSKERLEITIGRLIARKAAGNHGAKPFVQCFGEFEIFVNEEILIWKNSKAKEILAYLIHKKGIPQSWQKIVDAVWPEYNPSKAHANFNATMYLLRRILAEAGIDHILENKRGNYRIKKDEIYCDVYVFEEDAKRALLGVVSSELIQKLELLYQGVYMEETGYEWAYPKAGALEQLAHKLNLVL
ncbi:response regulator [Anoxybacterium hadale]|uniref:Response regulator n=1 Tax=Anoxybacterium hadale TaxID=3408580 RepID=A0ACD1ADC2_9FIRM|nr:response regulator [Clostridiales bacterium]